MKKYITTYLLALTLPLGELHTCWEKSEPVEQNWIWKVSRPMSTQWNVKYAVDQILPIFYILAALFYTKNRVNKTTVLSFIFLISVDTLMYFYNFKTYGYGWTYFSVALFWVIVYFWRSQNKQTWNNPQQ